MFKVFLIISIEIVIKSNFHLKFILVQSSLAPIEAADFGTYFYKRNLARLSQYFIQEDRPKNSYMYICNSCTKQDGE